MKQTLVIALYPNDVKEFITTISKEAIAETLDYAEEHFWTYVVLEDSHMMLPMSGLQEVHLYDVRE